MTALAEFLLARFADDDSNAGEYGDCHPAATWPHWALAQSSAKRRIVADYAKALALEDRGLAGPYAAGELSALEACCLSLAMPYTDHPDFDEAWRVPDAEQPADPGRPIGDLTRTEHPDGTVTYERTFQNAQAKATIQRPLP
jgi:Family of unknown function (DUF6221)